MNIFSFFIRIIGIVDTVALKLVLEENTETLLSSAVALSVRPADGANFQETSFSIADPNNVLVCGRIPVYHVYIKHGVVKKKTEIVHRLPKYTVNNIFLKKHFIGHSKFFSNRCWLLFGINLASIHQAQRRSLLVLTLSGIWF